MATKGSLSDKQKQFVQEYLIDLNATQAAIRTGYSAKTAQASSSRLLTNVIIQEAIAQAMKDRSERTQITADMVVQELARIGFSDLRKVLTDNNNLLMPSEWDDSTAAAIASVEVVTTHKGEEDEDGRKVPEHVHKIKVWDKNSALEKLGKHLGMFKERVEHTGKDGGPIETRTVDPKKLSDGAMAELLNASTNNGS